MIRNGWPRPGAGVGVARRGIAAPAEGVRAIRTPSPPGHPRIGSEPMAFAGPGSSKEPRRTSPFALAHRAGRAPLFEGLESRVFLSTAGVLNWDGVPVEAKTNSWIITFDEAHGADAAQQARIATAAMGVNARDFRVIGSGRSVVFDLPSAFITPEMSRWAAKNIPGVQGVDPNAVYKVARVPNDPMFSDQWQLENTGQFVFPNGFGTIDADVDAAAAWDIEIGTRSVIIAVIDTGVDLDHPDLAANLWVNPGEIPGNGIDDDGNGYIDDVNGFDFGDLDSNPDDDSFFAGHGTAVAGTIGAVGNNGIGVTGVAWNVSIMAIKIADRFGALSLDAIVASHDYLTTQILRGVNVVASNNSYGAFAPAFYEDQVAGFIAERAAIQEFIDAGGIFVAAAGNNANDNDSNFTAFPASYDIPGIISVAATDNNDALASYSNYGAQTVDLGASADNLWTTRVGGGYASFNGTSAASPMVAGAVALLKSNRPNSSAIEVYQALLNGADPVPSLQGRTVSGGRLNVAESLRIIGLDGPIVTRIDPGPVSSAPISQAVVTFNKPIDPANFNSVLGGGVGNVLSLVRSGGDKVFGNGNDIQVNITAPNLALANGNRDLVITAPAPLGIDLYRLTLLAGAFRDAQGNLLNGSTTTGTNEVYTFDVVGISGAFEPNDSRAQATPVPFVASGKATFNGITLGDGLHAALDVDLYRIDIPRGGLITATIAAQSLPSPSNLDSMLRLFNASGQQLAINDQFNGKDAFIDFFVTTGGSYYLGVSGFPNSNYNVNAGGSGTTQSTGAYNLSIEVALVENDRISFGPSPSAPKDIPAQGVVTDSIFIPDNRQVLDVNVHLDIEHTFVGDLRVSLISPRGTEVILSDRRGSSGDNFIGTIFDDEAPVAIANGAPPYTGSFRPDSPLSNFDGESALGNWTLRVADLTALNSGRLLSWSLDLVVENDIFGPFELNDSLGTARPLNVSGSTSINAFLGDGGFGLLDVDLFSFTATVGSTLFASVNSGGSLNSALRLFDPLGSEIKLSNPDGGTNSSIQGYVFAEGGTYFLGVSESANVAYNPGVAASGSSSATTGPYNLQVTLAQGVSDVANVLEGSDLRLGVSSNGTLAASDPAGTDVGIEFRGIEFLFNRSNPNSVANSFYGAALDGYSFSNQGPQRANDLPVSVVVQSDPVNRRVLTEGIYRGLKVERAISFGQTDTFAVFDVTLTNTTAAAMLGVAWMEGLNPNPGLNLDPITAMTVNDVDDTRPIASATFFNNAFEQGLTLSLAAVPASSVSDPGYNVVAGSFMPVTTTIRDPFQILDLPFDPNGAAGDLVMTLAFDAGTLAAGQSTTIRYFLMLGNTSDDVLGSSGLFDTMAAGLGAGHLAPEPGEPLYAPLEDGASTLAPLLPYRLYYPEGYANDRASTFLPIVNPHSLPARVVTIVHYEDPTTGARDQLIADQVVPANTRGGLTLTTPDLYASDNLLVRKDTPYAIEIRSDLPVAATFSHFDYSVSLGERLTAQTSTRWTFSSVTVGQGAEDFLVFFNAGQNDVKVTATFFPVGGAADTTDLVTTVAPQRRGGFNLNAEAESAGLNPGRYGVMIESTEPLVAALSSYSESGGYGSLGSIGFGATSGSTPEGQFGLNAATEKVTVLNTNVTAAAKVEFTFVFESGSAYRSLLTVPPRARIDLDVASLKGFPAGEAYGVSYLSNVPVAVELPTSAFGERESSALSPEAYTLWFFAEGFRPAGNTGQVTEYLRIQNPSSQFLLAEVVLSFDDGDSEIFRTLLTPGAVTSLDLHAFVTGNRRLVDTFYGTSVKAASPIVAYMGRSDNFFSGSFGTLGMPLGLFEPISG